ncbi:MAG: hypothetical protein EOO48_03150 [Flavobacterium sp.]|nr:MAG: hypothetical protein EOO48_03150 [Flavobacterium sp.]
MKKLQLLSLVALFFTAFQFSSCTGDVEPVDPAIVIPNPTDPGGGGNGGGSGSGVFKVDIDGTTYTATTTLVYITGGSIQLSAVRAAGDSFGFLLDGTTAGTYTALDNLLAYNQAGSEFGWAGFNPDNETENTGSLVITQVDQVNHTISGTFSFTGYWTDGDNASPPAPKHFTNGVFTNLPYTTSSPTGDTFYAKVNGVDFNQNDLLAVTTTINSTEFISIGAANANDEELTVSVKSSFGVGSHTITGSLATDGVQIMYTNSAGDEGQATSGSVSITEKTASRIKGTFSGVVTIGSTNYTITAGSFDAAY